MANEDGFVIEGKENIDFARLLTLRAAMRLEVAGMRRSRGRSVYALLRQEFGFKGSKQAVLDQINAMIAAKMAAKESASNE
jgi:hypothetical protein